MAQRDLNRFPEFAERLDALRRRVDMTQEEFAAYVGMSRKSMWRYLNGKQLPGGDEMLKLALKFPGELEWLLTGKDITEVQQWQALLAPLSAEEQTQLQFLAAVFGTRDPALRAEVIDAIKGIEGLVRRVIALGEHTTPPPAPNSARVPARQTRPHRHT